MITEIAVTLVVHTNWDGDPEDAVENATLAGTLQQAIEDAAPSTLTVVSVAVRGQTPLTQELRYCIDDDGGCCSLAQFRASNREAPELSIWCAQISKLAVGQSITLGGGAGAETVVRRVR